MSQPTHAMPSPRRSAATGVSLPVALGRRLFWHPEAYRLVRCLARHPEALTTIDVPFRPDPAVGVSAPWWNRHALRYLDARLKPGDRVFEWGSGGSTAWLLSKGARVVSVEDDEEWVEKVRARCPEADLRVIPGVATGTIRESFLEGKPHERGRRYFDDYVAVIDEFPDDSFDVVIVDGVCRVECFRRAIPKVRPGGLLVVDDTDMKPYRYRYLRQFVPGWETASFAGYKVSRDLRETTFYHRPG